MEMTLRREISQNLTDAGCDPEQIQRFFSLLECGQLRDALGLLAAHRKHLLEQCHAQQRRIDCLDYLVFRLEDGLKGGTAYGI